MACVNGDYSSATIFGKDSVACALGYQCKAKAEKGNWLVLVERGDWNGNTYPIKDIQPVLIDGEKIKADTWYQLQNGQVVEVQGWNYSSGLLN
ncbi:MAG: hypothetical protein AWM53_02024 [Candidatus Dichloromethanomonas elyunquensis]|nr:MAG: hypothetical protein AWM53_02024 [Candidatus Dichloromethanomonas elyunquensis]